MLKTQVTLTPTPISVEAVTRLHQMGLIQLLRPQTETLLAPPGENVGTALYESDERFGPHRLIAVGVNRSDVRLGMHPDNEEFLIPLYGDEVKPLYLVVCHLPLDELRRRDEAGTLTAGDFTCLSMYPCPRGAEMFTMPAGTIHCEATVPGNGGIGVFFVTESRDLTTDWIDLPSTTLMIS